MSDTEFENEFAKMIAAETAEPASLAGVDASLPPDGTKPAAKVKVAKLPKAPKVAEGPNPYGIHMNNGEVITMTYLRKWAQCASRGLKFNRAANIAYFTSTEFLSANCVGITTGQYSALCHNSTRWVDPDNPNPEPARAARTPATPEEKAAKAELAKAAKEAKKLAKQAAASVKVTVAPIDVSVASQDEAAILGDASAQ